MTVKQDEDPALPTMPAKYTAHMPTGPVPCCEHHAKMLRGLMSLMGTHVGFTAAEEGAECSNCLNEASKV